MISKEVKRARVTAIVFGALSGIALLAFVYGFIQRGIAREKAEAAMQHTERAQQCERLSKEMQLQAEQKIMELQKKNETLEQELKKSLTSRTK